MMEKLAQMSLKEFEATHQTGDYVLFFTADWCPDCRFIKPAMPEIEAQFSQFKFLLVDRDENLDLCRELDVFGIPSFVVYQNGRKTAELINKDRKTKAEVVAFLNGVEK